MPCSTLAGKRGWLNRSSSLTASAEIRDQIERCLLYVSKIILVAS